MIKEDGSAVHTSTDQYRVTVYKPDDDDYVAIEERWKHGITHTLHVPFYILAAYVDYHRDKLK